MKEALSNIHPELQQVARRLARSSFDFNSRNLWLVRLGMKLMRTPKPAGEVLVEDLFIPGHDHGRGHDPSGRTIRLRTYRPKSIAAPTPVLIWLHGGGYVLGEPEMDELSCTQYARELGIAVVSVDYRLAPQHPFQAGLEDGYAALKWVQSHSHELKLDAKRIAIGGASAGGGLAAGLVQMANDRREVRPVFQLLVYPMLDDRTGRRAPDDDKTGDDKIDDTQHVVWSPASNRFGWESYLGRKYGAKELPAYAAPARRLDLADLPPAWIGVGTADLFHDEDVAYARRLQAYGVDCELSLIAGAFHGFDGFDPRLPLVQKFRESQIAALRKHLFPSDTKA